MKIFMRINLSYRMTACTAILILGAALFIFTYNNDKGHEPEDVSSVQKNGVSLDHQSLSLTTTETPPKREPEDSQYDSNPNKISSINTFLNGTVLLSTERGTVRRELIDTSKPTSLRSTDDEDLPLGDTSNYDDIRKEETGYINAFYTEELSQYHLKNVQCGEERCLLNVSVTDNIQAFEFMETFIGYVSGATGASPDARIEYQSGSAKVYIDRFFK